MRARPPVAAPTDGTPLTPAWHRGPQQPGTAWGPWSTAAQPGWAWSGSTCTGTTPHLQGQKSLLSHFIMIYGDTTAPLLPRGSVVQPLHEGVEREARQLHQNKTTKRLEDHSRKSPFAQSKIHTNTHVCACESRLLCFSSYHVRFDATSVLVGVFTPTFSFFFSRRKQAEQEWKVDFRETKGGRKEWR